jgi:hypothetical protein
MDGELIQVPPARPSPSVQPAAEQRGVFFLRTTDVDKPLEPGDDQFAGAVIGAAVKAIDRAHDLESAITDRARLLEMAHTDPLTGCLNRRALVERLQGEVERVKRYDQMLVLLLVDLDNQDVNDGGDTWPGTPSSARSVALWREVRAVDIVARYRGDGRDRAARNLDGGAVFASSCGADRGTRLCRGPLPLSIGVAAIPGPWTPWMPSSHRPMPPLAKAADGTGGS